MSPQVARQIVALFQKTGPPDPPGQPLSPQERRLLSLLAEGHGRDVEVGLRCSYVPNASVRSQVYADGSACGNARVENQVLESPEFRIASRFDRICKAADRTVLDCDCGGNRASTARNSVGEGRDECRRRRCDAETTQIQRHIVGCN